MKNELDLENLPVHIADWIDEGCQEGKLFFVERRDVIDLVSTPTSTRGRPLVSFDDELERTISECTAGLHFLLTAHDKRLFEEYGAMCVEYAPESPTIFMKHFTFKHAPGTVFCLDNSYIGLVRISAARYFVVPKENEDGQGV